MSGARTILPAALALAVLAALWLVGTHGARNPERATPPAAESREEVAPAEMLAAPVTSAAEAPRREEEPGLPAVAPSVSVPAPEASAVTLEFLVTDSAKNPLAGARIQLSAAFEAEQSVDATTGADGRARIARPAWPNAFLSIEREGHIPFRDYLEPGALLTFELIRAVRLVGRVLDATTRAPLAGAEITCHQQVCRFCEPESVVSDAEGRYELAGVPASTEFEAPRFFVKVNGYPTLLALLDTSAAAEQVEHDFLLQHGRMVSGRVLSFPGRTPLERARVSADLLWLTTDALGRFQGQVSDAPGAQRLQASAAGHCTMLVDVAQDQLGAPLEILLPRASALEGTVRDGEGAPVPKATLMILSVGQDERVRREGLAGTELGLPENHRFLVKDGEPHASTDAEGRYRLEGFVPIGQHRLNASAKSFRQLNQPLEVAFTLGSTERLDLVLDSIGSTGTIRGRATLNGAPAKLSIQWKGPTRAGYTWARDDRYELTEVECGDVRLDVRLEGSMNLPEASVELQVTAGNVVEHDLDVHLPMGKITGHVRYENGLPAVGLAVGVSGAWLEAQTESDAEGAYAFEMPEQERPYLVVVRYAGDWQRRLDARPGGPPVDFVLPELAPLRFRVQDAASGADLAECSLSWRRPGEAVYRDVARFVPPDAEGWRTVSVPRGPLELLARADALGYLARLVTDVQAGEPDGATILLERGGDQRFTLAPGAEPFPDDHVLLLLEPDVAAGLRLDSRDCANVVDATGFYPHPSLQQRRLRFGADRGASLSGLASGVHRFRVCPDDLSIEPAEVTIEAGAREAILIRWKRQ